MVDVCTNSEALALTQRHAKPKATIRRSGYRHSLRWHRKPEPESKAATFQDRQNPGRNAPRDEWVCFGSAAEGSRSSKGIPQLSQRHLHRAAARTTTSRFACPLRAMCRREVRYKSPGFSERASVEGRVDGFPLTPRAMWGHGAAKGDGGFALGGNHKYNEILKLDAKKQPRLVRKAGAVWITFESSTNV